MTRPRSLLPDGPFHVMCNAVHGNRLFLDDLDRRRYMGLLQQTVERQNWRLLSFVLMGTHLHLVVWAPTSQLSRGMWWLNWRYAMWSKDRRPGHLGRIFGSTYKAKAILDDRYLMAVLRYIAQNPVDAGMTASPADYWWSADRALRSPRLTLDFLDVEGVLQFFDDGRAGYGELADGPEGQDHALVVRFAEPSSEQRPDLDELLAVTSSPAIAEAHLRWGYSLTEVGRHLGIHRTTVARRIADGHARGADGTPCDV